MSAEIQYDKSNLITSCIDNNIKLIISTVRENNNPEYIQICNNALLSLQLLQSSLLVLRKTEKNIKENEFYLSILGDLINKLTIKKTTNARDSVLDYRIMRYCEEVLKFIYTETKYIRWTITRAVNINSIIDTANIIKSCAKERRKLEITENENTYINNFIDLYLDGIENSVFIKNLMLDVIRS